VKPLLPTVTRRVIIAVLALSIGLVTNAWHRNIVSGLVVLITSVALAVWLGTQLSTQADDPPNRDPQNGEKL